jgi:hypothetical protein
VGCLGEISSSIIVCYVYKLNDELQICSKVVDISYGGALECCSVMLNLVSCSHSWWGDAGRLDVVVIPYCILVFLISLSLGCL